MSFTFPYQTKKETISLGKNSLLIESLHSLDETIDQYFLEYQKTKREELFEDLCPYFGVPWPAGIALASYCVEQEKAFHGETILEIGCGLALPSLALGSVGIPVECTDFHPDVMEFFRRNCAHNKITQSKYRRVDWRSEPVGRTWSRILASDVLYDRKLAEELFQFLDIFLAKEGVFILSDPGRPYFETFLQLLKQKQWKVDEFLRDGVFFLQCSRG